MLHVLPSYISNLIAAGEVVQRPSSVVKELIENSIDAGAENITVIIEDSGRTLIQVIDDGCGMTEEEAKLSFLRHATSKISDANDLNSILTYGFRGEALASIASVSEVSMKSRKKGSEVGSDTLFAESEFVSQESISCPEGTNICVRNLFYNVPARRKFLKSDSAEFRQILIEFAHTALPHYELSFKLIHNKKEIYNLRHVQNIKQRILEIEGSNLVKELVEVDVTSSIISISGYVGNPEDARKTPGNQYFFVNGRYFRSPYFHKAVMKAYEKLIPDEYLPSYYLFLEIDPKSIDINIHPSKTEVKFENESDIFQILNAAIRESLGKNAFVPSIDFDMEGAPDIPPARKDVYLTPPKIDFDPLFNPFDEVPDNKNAEDNYRPSQVNNYGEIFDEQCSSGKNILQLHHQYLITSVKSGLLLIQIARAKERIFYERFIKNLDNRTPIAQCTLFPITIELSAHDYSLMTESKDTLTLLGFDIVSEKEENTISVRAIPEDFPADIDSVHSILDGLIASMWDEGNNILVKAESRHRMALRLASSGSCNSNEKMGPLEAQLLIDSLFACAEPNRTPDGKKCMEIITIEDLERLL